MRNGLPFNPNNDAWDYERGRCFGFIAPLDMPLRIGTRLNPKALKLARSCVLPKAADMSKAKARKTALDQIVTQLRTILRRETADVVLAGKLLIESRKHLKHGEWQPWLAGEF